MLKPEALDYTRLQIIGLVKLYHVKPLLQEF